MGYNTEFVGELKFTNPMTAAELAYLESLFGEDAREHKDWDGGDVSYIDLELIEDKSGIKWSGSEKSYHMVEAINLIIKLMHRINHNFGLYGEMLAQGEEVGDIWKIVMKDNVASQHDALIKGKIICPHCNKEIYG